MSDELVRYEMRPPAVLLTLNRPDRRNALSRGLIDAADGGIPPRARRRGGAQSHPHREARATPSCASAWTWRNCGNR